MRPSVQLSVDRTVDKYGNEGQFTLLQLENVSVGFSVANEEQVIRTLKLAAEFANR
jgi:hypothetical protein